MRVASEGPTRITRSKIETAWARRSSDCRIVIRDADCRGLALVINATGMRWVFSYRPRGVDPANARRWPNKSVTLGNPATLSPDDARHEANRLKGEAATGLDPAATRKARAAAANQQRARTGERVLELYKAELPKRSALRGSRGAISSRHAAGELMHVKAALTTMEALPKAVDAITVNDVRRLLNEEAARVATARARFGALSRFFDWCVEEQFIPVNPCALISRARRPKAPQARSRFLGVERLAAIWKAADGLDEPVWRDLTRFLIAVPCRRGEGAKTRWEQIDLVKATWDQPAQLTKNGEAHRFHLPPLALGLLRERHNAAGKPKDGLAFPAPSSKKAIDTFHDIKTTLSTKAEWSDWTWHDFRRSFATALGERGIPEPVADAVLNHRQAATRGGVLGVYQRARRWPEQVKAMDTWCRLLERAIQGKPPETADVVDFPTSEPAVANDG